MIIKIKKLEKQESEYVQSLRCYHSDDAEKKLNEELKEYVVRGEQHVTSKLSDLLEIDREGE